MPTSLREFPNNGNAFGPGNASSFSYILGSFLVFMTKYANGNTKKINSRISRAVTLATVKSISMFFYRVSESLLLKALKLYVL